ncbi:hypothetical protein H4R35_003630 [Dimargaris xerosporica]|nr:hypothetical protein H4R35_003630 [Dimargaris xerosporica]
MLAQFTSTTLRTTAKVPLVSAICTRRFAAATSPLMKDIAQDIYLKNLRSFKPSAQKVETDQVKEYKAPKAPQAPKFDQDISADLAAYEAEGAPDTAARA